MKYKMPFTGNRWSPFLLHLAVSVIILSVVLAVLRVLWFPTPFFSATGGWQGFKLIAAAIIGLGPLLTFVAVNPHKPRQVMARDLKLIVALQCIALAWGVAVLYGQRPVAVVFWESEFYTVTANELAEHGRASSELDRFGNDRPVWVYRPKPATNEGLREILKQVTVNKVSPQLQIDAFLPYQKHFSDLAWHDQNIDEITQANQAMKSELEQVLRATGGKVKDFVYLTLKSKYRNVILVFTKRGDRIGYLYAPYLENP